MTRYATIIVSTALTLFVAYPVSALVLYEQTTSTTESEAFTSPNPTVELGTGLEGALTDISIYARSPGFSGFFPSVYGIVQCYNSLSNMRADGTFGSGDCGGVEFEETGLLNNTKTLYSLSLDSTVFFDSTKYYRIRFRADGSLGTGGVNTARLYGIASSIPGFVCYTATNASTTCTNIGSIYLVLEGYATEPPADEILRVNSPEDNEVFATNFVSFDFDYYYTALGTQYAYAGAEVTRLDVGQSVNVPEDTISAVGESTYFEQMYLTASSTYLFRPYLRTAGGTKLYGSSVLFYTNANPGGLSPLYEATSTTAQLSVLQQALFSRVPFLWFYQIQSAVEAGMATTSGSVPELVISTASSSVPITMTIFSEELLTEYIGTSTHATLYAIMQAGIWLSFLWALYLGVRGAFATNV